MWWWYFLAGLGGYVLISELFLRYPRLLHRRLSVPHRPVATSAHRGGLVERPENTLAAFDNAVQLGMHMLGLFSAAFLLFSFGLPQSLMFI